MENTVACIKDGFVENVIVCDDAFAKTLGFDSVVNVTNFGGLVQLGMKYLNGAFLLPPDETHNDWWNPNIPVTRI